MSEDKQEYRVQKYSETTEALQALSPDAVLNQIQMIQEVMHKAMKKGEHYGVIPGCGDKPTLLKPGAEKLNFTFRLAPKYKIITRELPNFHREYEVTCGLYHIETEKLWGEGVGLCSTMESKYRYRNASRKCPQCGNETIIKGKDEYGGGWVCYKKKGGCGAKFADGDKSIEGQENGKIENENIADTYNTVLKMAKKRAQVDATISATAASDIFTQDIEDLHEVKTDIEYAEYEIIERTSNNYQNRQPQNGNGKQPTPNLDKFFNLMKTNAAKLPEPFRADARALVNKKQEITDEKLQELEAAIFEHVENYDSGNGGL